MDRLHILELNTLESFVTSHDLFERREQISFTDDKLALFVLLVRSRIQPWAFELLLFDSLIFFSVQLHDSF